MKTNNWIICLTAMIVLLASCSRHKLPRNVRKTALLEFTSRELDSLFSIKYIDKYGTKSYRENEIYLLGTLFCFDDEWDSIGFYSHQVIGDSLKIVDILDDIITSGEIKDVIRREIAFQKRSFRRSFHFNVLKFPSAYTRKK